MVDIPNLELAERLGRICANDDTTVAACLRRVAAGAGAYAVGDAVTAERLLTTGVAGLPPAHPRRWIAVWLQVINSVYLGDPEPVERYCATLASTAGTPPWAHATGVCCAALINHYAGRPQAATAWMARHDALLTAVSPLDSFVAYTRGELAAATDPVAALAWFDAAAPQATTDEHVFNRQVATIGRTALLIRLGRHAEARASCRELLGDLRRLGMWAQLWTTVRLTAELLIALDDPWPAATLLAAADGDPLAPAVAGGEDERRRRLWTQPGARLGPDQLAGARTVGRGWHRTTVIAQAERALDRHA
jgi:hypothetical protein